MSIKQNRYYDYIYLFSVANFFNQTMIYKISEFLFIYIVNEYLKFHLFGPPPHTHTQAAG